MTRDRFEEIKRAVALMQSTSASVEADHATEFVCEEGVLELVAELERFFDPEVRPAVAIESPFAGNVDQNTRFARLALLDSLTRGEAPFAGHLLYTQVLADAAPAERELGLGSHLAYVQRSTKVVVYADLGVSSGMQRAICLAEQLGIPVETRRIG